MNPRKFVRRDFLKLSLTAFLSFLTLQVNRLSRALASGGRGSSPHRWAMVIDQDRCTGCNNCTFACQAHNDVPPDIQWNRVIELGKVGGQEVFLPMPCMHCEHAPCAEVCPVNASYYRPDGIVMMNYERCIGCRYCQAACPYGARAFNWEAFRGENPAVPRWGFPEVPRRPRGVVEKCSFCYQRIDRGLAQGLIPGVDREATPACVVACPVGARLFGNLNDPDSPVSRALAHSPSTRLREDLGTHPRVYYLPPRGGSES
jgi:Fe-S-cluster-containing dehydrogenase component